MENLIAELPDDRAVRELSRLLKDAPPGVSLGVLQRILSTDSRPKRLAGLAVARRVSLTKDELLLLLDVGLARQDVSEVQHWLELAAHTLGYRKLLQHLTAVASSSPSWIVHAWYQLVPLVRKNAAELMEKLDQMQRLVDSALQGQQPELQAFWDRTKASVS